MNQSKRDIWLPLLVLLALASFSELRAEPADPRAKFHVVRADGHGEQFLAGFYLYPYAFKQTAARLNRDYDSFLDAWLAKLTQQGFNLFYVTAETPFEKWLRLSEKYHFKMIVQLDFAYLNEPTIEEVRRKAPLAINFIRKYKDHPNVLAFNIKEEPDSRYMQPLNAYFQKIEDQVPDAPLHLLENSRSTLTYRLDAAPLIAATDRYAFWGWTPSAKGYMATPRSALKWFSDDLEPYARRARDLGADFQVVFTTAANIQIVSEDKVRRGDYGAPERILHLADAGKQGWSRVSADRLKYTKYYRPPPNCTRAMVWLAVLNGAQSILHWSGNPTDPLQENIITDELYRPEKSAATAQSSDSIGALARDSYLMQIFGPQNQGTYMLQEYADAAKKLSRFGWILNRMQPQDAKDGVDVQGDNAVTRAFQIAGFQGTILLVVNTETGTWQGDSVASLVGRDDSVSLDSMANLVGYAPATAARSLKIKPGTHSWANLASGQRLGSANVVSTLPGDAELLFDGSDSELAQLRQLSGLDVDTAPRPPSNVKAERNNAP